MSNPLRNPQRFDTAPAPRFTIVELPRERFGPNRQPLRSESKSPERHVMWLFAAHDDVFGNLPFKLEQGAYVLGRAMDCEITIADGTLSRRHARITYQPSGNLVLEDLASTNGTFVNGTRIERCAITVDSQIRLGSLDLRLTQEIPRAAGLKGWQAESTRAGDPKTMRVGSRTPLPRVLTTAQRQVCELLLEGLDEPAIAAELKRSIHTVHNHVRKIYAACDVHSREELLTKLLRRL